MTPAGRTEILVFGFGEPDAQFEGRLVGALERAESGGAIRVAEVLFAGRDRDSGELFAIRLQGGGGGLVAALAEFRLDRGRRHELTARAFGTEPGDPQATSLEDLGAVLDPGDAIAAIMVEHVWADALADAVARSGGRALADEVVPGDQAPELGRHALAAAQRSRSPGRR